MKIEILASYTPIRFTTTNIRITHSFRNHINVNLYQLTQAEMYKFQFSIFCCSHIATFIWY